MRFIQLFSIWTVLIALCGTMAIPGDLFAEKLCMKKKQRVRNGKVVLKKTLSVVDDCPRGYKEILDTVSFKGDDGEDGRDGVDGNDGAAGSQGPAGTDGRDRAWGDGSAGAFVVSVNQTLNEDNLQFTDVTVNAGVTLTVPSGTTIHCTGTFTNNGIVTVETNGDHGYLSATGAYPAVSPTVGVSQRSATHPQVGDNSAIRYGGFGGVALDADAARSIIRPPLFAGGSGAASAFSGITGGAGGGSIAIYAEGGIVNAGDIRARGGYGGSCSGGGAGGIIILATAGNVENSGTLSVTGATGGGFSASCASGGGGGGGLIHVLAQTFDVMGTLQITGGSDVADQGAGTVSAGTRSGGGGGGALIGDGGRGASAEIDGSTQNNSGDGDAGLTIIRTGFNPAGML